MARFCVDCEWLKNGRCPKTKKNNYPLSSDSPYINPDDWCADFSLKPERVEK